MEGRESKVVENVKKAMFIKGGRTNEAVSKALKEMVFYVYFWYPKFLLKTGCSLKQRHPDGSKSLFLYE